MLTPDQLADTTAYLFGVEKKAIFGDSRTHRVVVARQALAWALRQRDWSLESIGAYLRRDHTTIIYSIQIVERARERSESYAEKLAALAQTTAPPPVDWQQRIDALLERIAQLEQQLAERKGTEMATEKAPYKLTVKLDDARPETIAEALTQLRDTAGEYDQTGESSAQMVIESYQEGPLQAVMEAFESWLFHMAPGLDCEMKLSRPGLRPETRELLARAKRETPMDKEWQQFADKHQASIHGTVLGRRVDVEPVSSDREPR